MDYGWWDDYMIELDFDDYWFREAPKLNRPTPKVSM